MLGVRARATDLARRAWMRVVLTGVLSVDAHRRMELAYRLRDPWKARTPREQVRFAETTRFITEHVGGHIANTLEIGCGEGHQSEHLSRMTDHLTGLDVSRTAIERARRRVPSATFDEGQLMDQPWANERGRFDLVTACEVLYYVRDKKRLLEAMDRVGRHCVVTWYGPANRVCEAAALSMPAVARKSVHHEGMSWVMTYWKGEAGRG